MYKCTNCNCKFEEPERKHTTFEVYYGLGNLFPNQHHIELLVCPNCSDEDIEELQECAICGEWFEEDELHDTSDMENRDYGYCCEQCIEDAEIGGINGK